ncbi:MAG: helix-turn-helix domain-containing protein [Terriglobia bacterium]
MADLFTDALDSLTITEILAFLCLDLAEDKRPREGQRIDFKLDLPQDIGKDVAAMSNSDGGLIFIGVNADKAKQNVPVAADGVNLGVDAKARVTDRILSTVSPRPDFDIVAWRKETSSRDLLLIRVRPGPWPPYQYSQGPTVTEPVRIADTIRQATVAEIEGLFGRRTEFNKSVDQTLARLDSVGFSCSPPPAQEMVQYYIFHKIVLLPRTQLRLRFDQKLERDLKQVIRESFRCKHEATREARRDSYHEVELETTSILLRWRIWRDGSVGFLRSDNRPRLDPEPAGNLARDLVFFLRMAVSLMTTCACWGPFVFHDDLYCPARQLQASFPAPAGLPGYDGAPGIYFNTLPAKGQPSRFHLTESVDWAQVSETNTFVATALLQQLREVAGARADFETLRQLVTKLAADQSLQFA